MRKSLAALAFVSAALLPLTSWAWWNDDWNYRKEITLDTSPAAANIADSASDVPVLIRLYIGNFGYFSDVETGGADFRIVAGDDKTPLKYHVERFDQANQMAFVWVRVPTLAGGTNSQKIYLYYGNKKAPAGGDAAGTYDAHQVLVYHFNDADGALPHDATANGNNAASGSAQQTAASLIGGGLTLSGSGDVQVPSSASLRLRPDQGMTLSTWVRFSEASEDAYVLALQDQGNEFVLGISAGVPYARLVGTSSRAEAKATQPLDPNTWHQLAAELVAVQTGQDTLRIYVDGHEAGSAPIDFKPVEIAGTFAIGGSINGDHNLSGDIDEVQVSNIARSAAWLAASAQAQGQESPLLVYGNDAQREGDKPSYFKITLQNVTADGWVVIIVLAIMFVIAMLVMVSKGLYLAKVKKANTAFMEEFAKLRGDPTALDREETVDGDAALDESPFMPHVKDGEDRFRMSTIYRLYHHGVHEMTGRVHAQSVGAAAVRSRDVRALTPQTIDAIRAAMDASSVRLGQKLSSKMVLLTIAISGGPFLGLLGTVVGVMITFAAIAASGDVNVNSIAPGIAAALAATVAGLGVAIPSLFGYNWLNTQIKEIVADMRVFIDEFVTRVAEEYS